MLVSGKAFILLSTVDRRFFVIADGDVDKVYPIPGGYLLVREDGDALWAPSMEELALRYLEQAIKKTENTIKHYEEKREEDADTAWLYDAYIAELKVDKKLYHDIIKEIKDLILTPMLMEPHKLEEKIEAGYDYERI